MKFQIGYMVIKKGITLTVAWCYLIVLCLPSLNAHALVVGADSSLSVDCDSFCQIFDKKHFGDTFSTNTWSSEENQLCADVGAPVTSNYAAVSTPMNDSDGVAMQPLSCKKGPIPYTQRINDLLGSFPVSPNGQGDWTRTDLSATSTLTNASSERCVAAGHIADRCQYHNSSVEKYCMAYRGIKGDGKGPIILDSVLATVDASAAAVCWTACYANDPASITTCNAMGAIAGALEMLSTIGMESTDLAEDIERANADIEAMNYGVGVLGGVGMGLNVAMGIAKWKGGL